jgi:hypothetical protein
MPGVIDRPRLEGRPVLVFFIFTPLGFGIGFLLGLRKNDGLGIAILIGIVGAMVALLFGVLFTLTVLRGWDA